MTQPDDTGSFEPSGDPQYVEHVNTEPPECSLAPEPDGFQERVLQSLDQLLAAHVRLEKQLTSRPTSLSTPSKQTNLTSDLCQGQAAVKTQFNELARCSFLTEDMKLSFDPEVHVEREPKSPKIRDTDDESPRKKPHLRRSYTVEPVKKNSQPAIQIAGSLSAADKRFSVGQVVDFSTIDQRQYLEVDDIHDDVVEEWIAQLGSSWAHMAVSRISQIRVGPTTSKKRTGLATRLRALHSQTIMAPTSTARLIFDVCSVIVLLYDLLTIPYFIAWDVTSNDTVQVLQGLVICYWTLDILVMFQTGYIRDGEIEMRPAMIASNYFKAWFWRDFLVTILDWISLLLTRDAIGGLNPLLVVRISKLTRLLRIVAVLRLGKIVDVFTRIADRNVSQGVALSLQLIQLLFVVIYVNHVIGCVWFFVSTSVDGDTGAHWTDLVMPGAGGSYKDTTNAFQYLTSFHWSLTQMTPGSMQINAQNSVERFLNILCLIFGVLFFSSLISGISSKMVQVRMLKQESTEKIAKLVNFLRERNIESSLAFLVKQQCIDRMSVQKPVLEQNVEALSHLSLKLRRELHFFLCQPMLVVNSVFLVILKINEEVGREMCYACMTFMSLAPFDNLFQIGHTCDNVYILNRGTIKYFELGDGTMPQTVGPHTWLCEGALWCVWTNLGTADGDTVCEVLVINVSNFLGVVNSNPILKPFVYEYGLAYHKRLVATDTSSVVVDDLVDGTDSLDLLAQMPQNLQALVGYVAIQSVEKSWHWKFRQPLLAELADEVRTGKAVVVPTSDGEVERVVHLACLQLLHEEGFILALVGKWDADNGVALPGCKLPGTKCKGWEDQEEALRRLIREDMALLEEVMVFGSVFEESEEQKSEKYGITTRYNRKIFQATLQPERKLPALFDFVPRISGYQSQRTSRSSKLSRSNSADFCKSVYSFGKLEGKSPLFAWLSSNQLHGRGQLEVNKWFSAIGVNDIVVVSDDDLEYCDKLQV